MKICIVTPIVPPIIGGPSTYVPKFSEIAKKMGHQCFIVAYVSKDEEETDFEVQKVQLKIPIFFRQLVMIYKILRVVKKNDIDIIYPYDPIVTGFPSMIAAKILRKPVVQRIVNDPSWEVARSLKLTDLELDEFQNSNKKMRIRIIRILHIMVSKNADAIITPSKYIKNLVLGWGVENNKVTVVYNACDVDIGNGAIEDKKSMLPKGRKMILTVCRFDPWKNVDEIIKAISKIPEDVTLFVIGEGQEKDALERLAKKLGIEVRFLGRLDNSDVIDYMRLADVFVLFSTYEGLSHTLLEAMSCGCPSIVSSIESNIEIVSDNENGLLVEPHNLGELTRKIRDIILSEEVGVRLGENAKIRASEFTWEKTVSESLKVFKKVIGD